MWRLDTLTYNIYIILVLVASEKVYTLVIEENSKLFEFNLLSVLV